MPTSSQAFDPTAPIIIVGAGRSGTSRLLASLRAHPHVYMSGEMNFLLPRLWSAFHDGPECGVRHGLYAVAKASRPEWREASWSYFMRPEAEPEVDAIKALAAEFRPSELGRLHRVLGAAIAEMLVPPTVRTPRWGFKEIWSGGDAFPYGWDIYHSAFPNAWFVQSVRHPIDYLGSVISYLKRPQPSEDEVVHELTQWVKMVEHSRTLRHTGRYIEFRMEDFEVALPGLLSALGLDEDPICAEVAELRYVPSDRRLVPVTQQALDRVEGLRELAKTLGYGLPDGEAERDGESSALADVVSIK